MELKNKTSWFNKNGCYKVLVIFTVISIICFGIGMFILGRQSKNIEQLEELNLRQNATLTDLKTEYFSRKVNVTKKEEKIDPKIVEKAQDFTTLALMQKFTGNDTTAAEYIVTSMEKEFSGKWTAILGQNFTYSAMIQNKAYVRMTYGKKTIVVFKSSD